MRKSLVLVMLIVVLAVVPSMVCAQALFGKKCKDDANKFFVTGAWVHSFDTHYTLDEKEGGIFVDETHVFSDNYNAFQVGLGFPLVLGDEGKFGTFLLGGTIAIPSTSDAEWGGYTGTGALVYRNNWKADTYYATAEGLWAYPVYAGWSALAGFRWVYWQTSYKNPYDAVGLVRLDSDTSDLTVNGYVPFVGIMTSMRGLTVGAVGFPTILGRVEHKMSAGSVPERVEIKGDFDGGYFAEIFVDYNMPTFKLPGMEAGLSVFAKVSFLHAEADVTWKQLYNLGTQDYDLVFQRNLLFLGAKATFDFDLPSWPGSRILYY